MLKLAFENLVMIFLTFFEDSRCPEYSKMTKSFSILTLQFSPCLDCLYTFLMKQI